MVQIGARVILDFVDECESAVDSEIVLNCTQKDLI